MNAKVETIVTVEFTIREPEYHEYEDIGAVAKEGDAYLKAQIKDFLPQICDDIDNVHIKTQHFFHEKPERKIITYREDFLSKMQDAPVHGYSFLPGTPKVCRNGIYGGEHKAPCTGAKVTDTPLCVECWDEAMPEEL